MTTEVTPMQAMEVVPDEAKSLLGALMTASARDLAWTNEQLRRSEEESANHWRKRYIKLMDSLYEAEEQIDSRRLSVIIDHAGYHYDQAARELDSKKSVG